MTERLTITEPEDGGNIDVLDASDPADVRLAIRPDGKAPFHQWFSFVVEAAPGQAVRMVVENAGISSYPGGWPGYRAVASEDGEEWERVPTTYENGQLVIEHAASGPRCAYAYFAPYERARYDALLKRCQSSPLARHDVLGRTLDGGAIDRLHVGNPDGAPAWIIARQHPGESMGGWWMEGFLPKLLDEGDSDAARVREAFDLHVVPSMNPDGAARGHLRTNAAGTDLNRAWAQPTAEHSPEVLCVRRAMERSGVDFFLDVHGDEVIANNFIAGAKGIPAWTDRLEGLEDTYQAALVEASDSFQREEGYPVPAPGTANPKIATNWVAQTFDALGMTLEMPFKDARMNPDERYGWSPERCAQLGRDCLTAMTAVIGRLR